MSTEFYRPINPDHRWWHDHDKLVQLAHHMADTGETAENVADMIEKPWRFDDEWQACVEAYR